MIRRAAILCVALAPAALLWAQPGADDAARRLEQWRARPAHLERLRQSWRQFQELPAERRAEIIRLDEELHRLPASEQARLEGALQRYADWLAQLPEADRARVAAAATKTERLAVIRELRDRQWMAKRPRAVREQWAKLHGAERDAFVTAQRAEARQRKREWTIAARFWKDLETRRPLPSRPADFPAEVRIYLEEFLKPMLRKDEKDRLTKAEGSWPGYPLTLVELADRHPLALPGPHGPRTIAELPQPLHNRLAKPKQSAALKALRAREGRWPEFARELTRFAAKRNWAPFPHELWPWSFKGLSPTMQTFVEKTLRPVLNASEQTDLLHSEGSWPEFPQTIDRLARAHDLRPPWHTLPGSRERWDAYRLGRPATDRPGP